jgi:membrane protease YdiL (CAAX protease family)
MIQGRYISIRFPGISYIIPIVLYFSLVFTVKPLRKSVKFLTVGNIDLISILLLSILVILSITGIVGWKVLSQPDTSSIIAWIPQVHPLILLAGGFGFAISNSFVEEFIFRGALWDGLEASNFRDYLTIMLQAVLFGVWHFKGFPGGVLGTILVFVWGVLLGIIRRRTGGLFIPVVAHICADITIFIIIFLEFLAR